MHFNCVFQIINVYVISYVINYFDKKILLFNNLISKFYKLVEILIDKKYYVIETLSINDLNYREVIDFYIFFYLFFIETK